MLQELCTALTQELTGTTVVANLVTYTLHPVDPPPPNWDTAALPGHYILTGGADDESMGGDGEVTQETRVLRIQIPVVPVGQATAHERETRSRAMLDTIKQRYRVVCRTARIAGVRSMRVMGDSGVVVLPEYDSQFVGFEIRLEVKIIIDP